MLSVFNAYCHGYIAIPILEVCRKHGLFTLLSCEQAHTDSFLIETLKANPGYFKIALHALESLGWLDKTPDGSYLLTEQVQEDKVTTELIQIYKFSSEDLLTTNVGKALVIKHIDMLLDDWADCPLQVSRLAEGALLLSLLISLKYVNSSCQKAIFSDLSEDLQMKLRCLFVYKQWAVEEENDFTLTDVGKELLDRVNVMAIAASYRPMLANMEHLLFGDASLVFAIDENGDEMHVDRSMNVIASGFQHGRYFEEAKAQIISLFNQLPIENQPKYVADMGCGDGTFLKEIYSAIQQHSKRGEVLDKYPVTLIGVDYNRAALKETEKTLVDYPHLTLFGDINKPKQLIKDLVDKGVHDPEEILHVRSFLDHNFSYTPTTKENTTNPIDELFPSDGAYINKAGESVSMPQLLDALRQHLQNWSKVISRHGMLLLESHCLPVEGVRAYFNATENFYFDTLHAFSRQYLISAEAFLIASANVGLFPKTQPKRYPKTLPFCRITLNHFEKRDYSVRFAETRDLDTLYKLEKLCWAKNLRSAKKKIRHRLKNYPQGQFVLELNGDVVGVIYSQRISSVEDLKGKTADSIHTIHVADGQLVQLIAINIDPAVQERGLGDQLLEFMLQRCSLIQGVRSAVGVTLCKDYSVESGFTLDDYIRNYDERGNIQDPILRFHQSHGASIEKVIPGYRPKDLKNEGCGILIHYDLRNRTRGQSHTVAKQVSNDTTVRLNRKKHEQFVEQIVKACLGKKKEAAFAIDRPLMEMGLDSADLLELNEQLRYEYRLELEPAFFFQYNTAEKVIAYLQKTLLDSVESVDTGKTTENISTETNTESITRINSNTDLKQTDTSNTDIAITGAACRLPGDIHNAEQFWDFLQARGNGIVDLPEGRFNWPKGIKPDSEHQGINRGGFIKDIAAFDAAFFRITPKEAKCMDPQQRLLLELTWHCLEDAGCNAASLAGNNVGVFIAASGSDYSHLLAQSNMSVDAHFGTGSSIAILANRLSYFFDFSGPSLVSDTACSGSLVAIHQAVQSLRSGECEQALVGGINLICHPGNSVAYYKAGMLSKEGQCKTFDEAANGYVRAEGAVMLSLKPLQDALKSNDPIYAVIKGSACNHGGLSGGLTVPNPEKQAQLLQQAWNDAGILPETLGYIETHGTGTSLGDPIEIQGIKQAFAAASSSGDIALQSCGLGALKSNIGHLEAAAGIAGLLKSALCLKHKSLIANVNFNELNPKIQLDDSPFYILNQAQAWPAPVNGKHQQGSRRTGISSFGFGGANAHVVLEEAPTPFSNHIVSENTIQSHGLPFVLSAKNQERLQVYARRLLSYLNSKNDLSLTSVVYTLQRRQAMEERVVFIVRSIAELQKKLMLFTGDGKRIEDCECDLYEGNVQAGRTTIQNFLDKDANQALIKEWMEQGEFGKVACLWVDGLSVDWDMLYKNRSGDQLAERPDLIHLPTYPFEKKTYWITEPTTSWSKKNKLEQNKTPQVQQMLPNWTVVTLKNEVTKNNHAGLYILYMLDPEAEDALLKLFPKQQCIALPVPNKPENKPIDGNDYIEAYSASMEIVKTTIKQHNPTQYVLLSNTHYDFVSMLYAALQCVRKEMDISSHWYSWPQKLDYPQVTLLQLILNNLVDKSVQNTIRRIGLQAGELCCEQQEWYYAKWNIEQNTITCSGIRQGGVYWITGGNGGIGRKLAAYLVQKYAATVILSGRSGTSETLSKIKGVMIYQAVDCTDQPAMQSLYEKIIQNYGKLNGVIHAAGVIRDKSLFFKTQEDIEAVMQPKIEGVQVLDDITKLCPLDFFLCFSSMTALLGNPGQTDYAAANVFLQNFIRQRQQKCKQGERNGTSVVVHWPYWQDGGMQLSEEQITLLQQSQGTRPLSEQDGMAVFEDLLQKTETDIGVFYGAPQVGTVEVNTIEVNAIEVNTGETNNSRSIPDIQVVPDLSPQNGLEHIEPAVKQMLAELIHADVEELDPSIHFTDYGVDSILIQQFIKRLNEQYALELSALHVHKHPSITALSEFITQEKLQKPETLSPSKLEAPVSTAKITKENHEPQNDDIAIVGVNLNVPGATTLEEFWELLETGVATTTIYPEQRWQDLPGEITLGKQRQDYDGNFLENVLGFDHRLFKISPREAMLMDPQQRLVLQSVWQAIENAGYSKAEFAEKTTSVFLSINSIDYADVSQYDDHIDEFTAGGFKRYIAANRISHVFNLQGLSETVDTACSSVFVALDRAVDVLRKGLSEQAIVAGVQINLLPKSFDVLKQQGLLSEQGRTLPFDEKADGFVRAEGVGSVILKPLMQAQEDNDHVYAVIKNVGVWHAGKSLGLTAPNSNAHQQAMQQALQKSAVSIDDIAYLEAHGTAMSLGDAAEVDAFTQVFKDSNRQAENKCILSAIKSTLGHLEAASGMAVLMKAILSMQKGRVPGVPGLNKIHQDIDTAYFQISDQPQLLPKFEDNNTRPYYVGLNSYGLGGVSAFVLLAPGQRHGDVPQATVTTSPELFVLSALTQKNLLLYLDKVEAFLTSRMTAQETIDFQAFIQTYQRHREVMPQRLAIITHDAADLLNKIKQFKQSEQTDYLFSSTHVVELGDRETVDLGSCIKQKDWVPVAKAWVSGLQIPWADSVQHRSPFPEYAFDTDRPFWISRKEASSTVNKDHLEKNGLGKDKPEIDDKEKTYLMLVV